MWQPYSKSIVTYLKKLKTLQGVNLIFTQKKTGFFGMICNIFSIQEIYDLHIEKGTLFYLCTYKFSQDYLEHFFGLMRSKFGATSNPTCISFRGIYRKILVGITKIDVKYANVSLQDDTEIVGITPNLQTKMTIIEEDYEIFDDLFYADLPSSSSFKDKIVEYIGGFVIKRVLCKLDCDACTDSIKSTSQPKDSLITLRDYGNYLFYPSNFVILLLTTAEKALGTELKRNCLSKSFIFDKIVIQIESDFFNLNSNVIQSLDEHAYKLCKNLVSVYTFIRFKHHAKLVNFDFKKGNLCSRLNRLAVFKNL